MVAPARPVPPAAVLRHVLTASMSVPCRSPPVVFAAYERNSLVVTKNLLVPVCASASHADYGSLQMEPV